MSKFRPKQIYKMVRRPAVVGRLLRSVAVGNKNKFKLN